MLQYPSMPVWSGLATPVLTFPSSAPRKTLPLKGMAGAVGTHVFLIGGNPTLPLVLLVLNTFVAWSRRSVVLSVRSRMVKGV